MRPSSRFFFRSANLTNAGIPLALAPLNHSIHPFFPSLFFIPEIEESCYLLLHRMAKGKIGVVVVFPSHFLLLPLPSSGSEEQFVLPKWGADQDSYDSKSSVLWFFLFGGCFLSALGCWLFFFGYWLNSLGFNIVLPFPTHSTSPVSRSVHAGGIPMPLVDGELIHCKVLRPVSFPQKLASPVR